MKTVTLVAYGDVDQLRIEQTTPARPGPGEVLITVAAAGVNPVDTKLRSGMLHEWLPLELPTVLGCDFAGTIAAVGPGVDQGRIGERVMGMVGVTKGGAYAEQIVALADEAIPVPDGLDLVEAAALPMGVMTGYDLIELGVDVQPGERVIVTGAAGSVGRAAAYAAFARGAEVVAVVRSQPAVPISGAATTIEAGDAEALAAIGQVDCVADTVGGESAVAMLAYVRPGGRFVSAVAEPPKPEGSSVAVSWIVVSPGASKLLPFARAVATGQARIPTPHRFALEDAAAVHRRLEEGGVGAKLLLIP